MTLRPGEAEWIAIASGRGATYAGRRVGLANGHVVRWTPPPADADGAGGAAPTGAWSVHLP